MFSRRFGDTILSAIVIGEELHVETVNGNRFVYNARTGKQLETNIQNKPDIGNSPAEAHPEQVAQTHIVHAAA